MPPIQKNGVVDIFLKGREPAGGSWVDPCSDEDCYPQKMWQDFSVYLQELTKQVKTKRVRDTGCSPFTFSRGRYGMAVEL